MVDPLLHTARPHRSALSGFDSVDRILADAAILAPIAVELDLVETMLGELLQSSIAMIPCVDGDRGRLRPLVTLLAAQAAGYHEETRITIAAAGELLYTATTLHDDVSDSGEFRRGRPLPRLGHGNGLTVLIGDFCYGRALEIVARLGETRAICSMADAVVHMSEGEVARLHVAGVCDLDRERHAKIVERRTAALLGWCASVGHLLAPGITAALDAYGRALGFALQIADELLDVEHAGQELRDGKVTLPVILAWEQTPGLRARVAGLLEGGAPVDEAWLADVLAHVGASGGVDEARAIAASHVAAGQAALAALAPSRARAALAALAQAVVDGAQDPVARPRRTAG